MARHIVETVPDDSEALRTRLDDLTAAGASIISVVWQPNRVVSDQAAAFDASGSFVIIAESADVAYAREDALADTGVPIV